MTPGGRIENIEAYKFTSGEKAREAGRKGGIASGKAKARRKTMQEVARMMLESDVTPEVAKSIKRLANKLHDDDCTISAAIVAQQISRALKGDLSSARWLSELQGDTVPVGSQASDALSDSLDEQAAMMEAERAQS